jgi:hypothetical protein
MPAQNMNEFKNQTARLNEPPEPSLGLSAAMPWVVVEQSMRPEGARESLEKTKRVVLNAGHSMDERFSRPFRAEGLFAFQSQGIAHSRSALGCILKAFQAIMSSDFHAAF